MNSDVVQPALEPAPSLTWRIFSRTRMLAYVGMGTVFLLGVLYLMLMVVEMGRDSSAQREAGGRIPAKRVHSI